MIVDNYGQYVQRTPYYIVEKIHPHQKATQEQIFLNESTVFIESFLTLSDAKHAFLKLL